MSDKLLSTLYEWTDVAMRRSMLESLRFNQANGYSFSQINSLFYINRERQATINDLTKHLGVTKAAVSQLVDRLVEQNLVDRKEDPQDRRSRLLTLTPLGKAKVQEAKQARHAWLVKLVNTFSPSQKAEMEPALDVFTDGLRRFTKEEKKCSQQDHSPT